MSYNLIEFGKELRRRRKLLRLTQLELSNLSDIHVDTIRKIEQGKVLPAQLTLDLLSNIIKEDLNSILLKYRICDYDSFISLRNRIEAKFDRDDYNTLDTELEELKMYLDKINNEYLYKQLIQLILLIESVILNKRHNQPEEAFQKLTDAINVTIPRFNLERYNKYVYNDMEIRIFMNIALLLNKLGNESSSLNFLNFSIENINDNSSMIPKISYNLSYTYHRLQNHHEALKYAEKGISYCINNRNFNGLNLLYFRKGIAEFHLNIDTFMNSLNKAIYQSELLGQANVKKMIINNCKDMYGIELEI